ncbi:MAG: DUF2254 domain-containing protein [Mucilaginibacter sp.]|uniref:DUF2254 domain-containing protein n=1 Tax=Mucilaginibacter sp. TaxID=1882438 RepID=UPI003267B0E1
MSSRFIKWLRGTYNKIVTSIAFYPALIAIGFLVLSWLMLELDFSETGKHIKSYYSWIRLKDASTARSIVSTISGGIISLMVFSFSMVMILLNQAASQMSNRMLESMIGNRFQQLVLGTYIGTIVYSLFLLSTIRDIESGIYVPALSIYLLVALTVIDIFVFIYFLHYVTQSVKFETIIERVHHQTLASLQKICTVDISENIILPATEPVVLLTQRSGTFQGFDQRSLLKFIGENSGTVQLIHPAGTYLLVGQPILKWYGKPLSDDCKGDLLLTLDFYSGQPVTQNAYYGFHQLAEVALKALSPGINDPETAVLSLHALADLFAYRSRHHPQLCIQHPDDKGSIILTDRTFEDLFAVCIYPIWDYGKNDRYIQLGLYSILTQLLKIAPADSQKELLAGMLEKVDQKVIETSAQLPLIKSI